MDVDNLKERNFLAKIFYDPNKQRKIHSVIFVHSLSDPVFPIEIAKSLYSICNALSNSYVSHATDIKIYVVLTKRDNVQLPPSDASESDTEDFEIKRDLQEEQNKQAEFIKETAKK